MILALKLKFALAAAAVAAPLATIPELPGGARGGFAVPELVEIAPGSFMHRLPGDFSRNRKPANAPVVAVRIDRPVSIMTRQVTAAEYQRCVADGACAATEDEGPRTARPLMSVGAMRRLTPAGCPARPA
jgi:formylglycine-generating enzyme required for sulfatase activity